MNDDRLTPVERSDMRDLVVAGVHRIRPVHKRRAVVSGVLSVALIAAVIAGTVSIAASVRGRGDIAATPTVSVIPEFDVPQGPGDRLPAALDDVAGRTVTASTVRYIATRDGVSIYIARGLGKHAAFCVLLTGGTQVPMAGCGATLPTSVSDNGNHMTVLFAGEGAKVPTGFEQLSPSVSYQGPQQSAQALATQRYAECLIRRGYTVTEIQDKSFHVDSRSVAGGTQYDADDAACAKGNVASTEGMTDNDWKTVYDKDLELVACLAAEGYQVTDVPTLDAFKTAADIWNPYAALLADGRIDDSAMQALQAKCPPVDYWPVG